MQTSLASPLHFLFLFQPIRVLHFIELDTSTQRKWQPNENLDSSVQCMGHQSEYFPDPQFVLLGQKLILLITTGQ